MKNIEEVRRASIQKWGNSLREAVHKQSRNAPITLTPDSAEISSPGVSSNTNSVAAGGNGARIGVPIAPEVPVINAQYSFWGYVAYTQPNPDARCNSTPYDSNSPGAIEIFYEIEAVLTPPEGQPLYLSQDASVSILEITGGVPAWIWYDGCGALYVDEEGLFRIPSGTNDQQQGV